MATAQANPSTAPPEDIDYWKLEPRISSIEWSNEKNAWLAHLHEDKTGLKGCMKVCIDCVTVHVYHDCDRKGVRREFCNCDTNKPVYHPSYIKNHYDLEPNNKYVQQAILRTHRRKLVPVGPHNILDFRGYDPIEKTHGWHIPKCFLGSSPEYVIQGSGGIGTSIYYRRCDGKFRNLAYQVLQMGSEAAEGNQSLEATDGRRGDSRTSRGVRTAPQASYKTSGNFSPNKLNFSNPKVVISTKRKRDE